METYSNIYNIKITPQILEKNGFKKKCLNQETKKHIEQIYYINDFISYHILTNDVNRLYITLDYRKNNDNCLWNVNISKENSVENIGNANISYVWQFNKLMEIFNSDLRLYDLSYEEQNIPYIEFKQQLIEKSSKLSESIINQLYDIIFLRPSKWIYAYNDYYYIVGLAEDKYDYYWICISKLLQIKFISCTSNINIDISNETKIWSNEEKKSIYLLVKKYFASFSEEILKLIYMCDEIDI